MMFAAGKNAQERNIQALATLPSGLAYSVLRCVTRPQLALQPRDQALDHEVVMPVGVASRNGGQSTLSLREGSQGPECSFPGRFSLLQTSFPVKLICSQPNGD